MVPSARPWTCVRPWDGPHDVWVHYHFVFIPTYRQPVVRGEVGIEVRDLIREIWSTILRSRSHARDVHRSGVAAEVDQHESSRQFRMASQPHMKVVRSASSLQRQLKDDGIQISPVLPPDFSHDTHLGESPRQVQSATRLV